jgi:hypothetical protein
MLVAGKGAASNFWCLQGIVLACLVAGSATARFGMLAGTAAGKLLRQQQKLRPEDTTAQAEGASNASMQQLGNAFGMWQLPMLTAFIIVLMLHASGKLANANQRMLTFALVLAPCGSLLRVETCAAELCDGCESLSGL